MKKSLLALVVCSLFLAGCTTTKANFSTQNSGKTSSETNSSGTSQSSNGSTNSSAGGNSSTGGSSSDEDSSEDISDIDAAEDLGVMTAAQANEYLLNHASDIPVNSFGNGVDKKHKITIKGYALNRFDLKKETKNFGLEVTYSGKVVIGDATDYVVCATGVTSEGTTLYGKVGDNAGKDTSRFEVTGFPSISLGQLELCIPSRSFTWDEDLDVQKDIESYVYSTMTLDQFYETATDIPYNCAGHGYGNYVKINNLTVRDFDAGSGQGVYLMTDGTNMLKVVRDSNALSMSVGSKYNIIGIMTTANYSPAIRLLKAESVLGPGDSVDISSASVLGSVDLRKIQTSKDDTLQRFPNFVKLFRHIYKAEVYLSGHITTNSKIYIGFSDEYLGSSYQTSRDVAVSKGIVYIDNDYFWDTTQTKIDSKNGYKNYINQNQKVTIYYMPQQLEYLTYSGKQYPVWKVVLLPETIPAVS